jgi:AcrR family transcriptional regulator
MSSQSEGTNRCEVVTDDPSDELRTDTYRIRGTLTHMSARAKGSSTKSLPGEPLVGARRTALKRSPPPKLAAVSETRGGGRPRDAQLDRAILDATRDLLAVGGYAQLSMEKVAARAQVGKQTIYRRWSSKAPLVADAVLDAYGRGGSFPVGDTGDIRADLQSWLDEHAEFVAEPSNAALMRAVIAAAASSSADGEALYQQLSAPQYEGLVVRLQKAAAQGELRSDADLDAIANALIGTLLLHTLRPATTVAPLKQFSGLLDALLGSALNPT